MTNKDKPIFIGPAFAAAIIDPIKIGPAMHRPILPPLVAPGIQTRI